MVSNTPRPHYTPRKDLVPIVQEAGWAQQPVWTGVENLTPTRIRSLDRPARSQSLYWLSYPAHNYNIQYHVMNSVSVYSTLTTKKLIKHSLLLLLMPFVFTSWCLPLKKAAVVSQHIWTPFSTVPLFHLGHILVQPFAIFIVDSFHVFRKEIRMSVQKVKFQWHVTPQSNVRWK